MEENKRYWKGIEEFTNDTDFVKLADKEFPDYLPMSEQRKELDEKGNGRRDFLKLLGFSVAAASLAACEAPVKKAIPYLNKPDEISPSIANFYASTYFIDGEYCSILVKTREGRPIKIEGNKLSSVTKGGTGARTQASVLSLYDTEREKYKEFLEAGSVIAMQEADTKIKGKLSASRNIRIVSPTIISPSTKSVIAEFIAKYPGTRHIMYDANSAYGILKANQESFGKAMIPSYNFDKAEVVVSFGADFLGTWLSPVEFARQYAKKRKVSEDNKQMSRHYQFESRLSMTGANADYRSAIRPLQEGLVILALYNKLTGKGEAFADARIDKMLDKAVADLNDKRGKSLIVSGSNDVAVQTLVNVINNYLGNYGKTIDTATPSYLQQGNDLAMSNFVDDVANSKVDAVIFYGANPVYNHPKGAALKEGLKNVGLKISFADRPDETSAVCDFICPDNHYLESWTDAEPKKGHFSLGQPAITPLFKTRQAQESLMTWAGIKGDFYTYIRKYWDKNLYTLQNKHKTTENFWNNTLHDGVFETKASLTKEQKTEEKQVLDVKKDTLQTKIEKVEIAVAGVFSADAGKAIASISSNYSNETKGIEVVLYEKTGIGAGSDANNPWLQELPDPISKATWDNYVAMPIAMAKEMGVKQGDVVKVELPGKTAVELPTLLQPGQANGTISIAVGYGREVTGKVAEGVGKNVYPLAEIKEGIVSYNLSGATVSKTGSFIEIAQTQTHNTIMGRKIVQEATLGEYQKDFKKALKKYQLEVHTSQGHKKPSEMSLWTGHKYPNHSWGMIIDLNSCIGCGICSVACQVENNVSVVGKKEVINRREMHWIRIDRYYSTDADLTDRSPSGYTNMEQASENPEIVFQPMMCQHCNNAPCETVCPVLATTHSTEGLNQMTYNRCIGTRYCANNCPYKVRRFNWFHYAEDDRFTAINYSQTTDLGRMVLNPDVTVRSRGVMEKCSLCVQRIQATKLEAKKEKRKIKDGEFTVACAQSCPTDAIIFGDMNDTESVISKMLAIKEEVKKGEHGKKDEVTFKITEPRAFHVLDEINVRPQVSYLTKIRNKDKETSEESKKESEHKS